MHFAVVAAVIFAADLSVIEKRAVPSPSMINTPDARQRAVSHVKQSHVYIVYRILPAR